MSVYLCHVGAVNLKGRVRVRVLRLEHLPDGDRAKGVVHVRLDYVSLFIWMPAKGADLLLLSGLAWLPTLEAVVIP